MFRLLMLVSVPAVLGVLFGLAAATTVEEKGFREMVTETSSIVHGTVVSSSSRWTENRSLIVTDIRIRVHEVLKGESVPEVVVTQPGGKVGGVRVDADGAVGFRDGGEAVLFLDRSSQGHTYVVGLFQGRFDVVTDKRGNKLVRGMTPENVNVLRSSGPGDPAGTLGLGASGTVRLDSFLGGVREMVRDAVKDGGR